MKRLRDFLMSERLWEKLSWPEAALAFALTPIVMVWFRDNIAVVVGVSMWTWFRGAVGNALSARAGRRADPDDSL